MTPGTEGVLAIDSGSSERQLVAAIVRATCGGGDVAAGLKALGELIDKTSSAACSGRTGSDLDRLGGAISTSAHEVNNVLTAIIGYAELLATADLDPRHRRIAERIGHEALRAGAIVTDLTERSREPGGASH